MSVERGQGVTTGESPSGSERVRKLRNVLHAKGRQEPDRRSHALADRVWRMDFFTEAWAAVRRNGGSAGGDIGDTGASGVERWLGELSRGGGCDSGSVGSQGQERAVRAPPRMKCCGEPMACRPLRRRPGAFRGRGHDPSESRMREIRTSGLTGGGEETRPRWGMGHRHRAKAAGQQPLPAPTAGRALPPTLRFSPCISELSGCARAAVIPGRVCHGGVSPVQP